MSKLNKYIVNPRVRSSFYTPDRMVLKFKKAQEGVEVRPMSLSVPSLPSLRSFIQEPDYTDDYNGNYFLEDKRKYRRTTGKLINPNIDLKTGKYKNRVINTVIQDAIDRNIDPKIALSIGLVESGLNENNTGHVLRDGRSNYLDILKIKMAKAQADGHKDLETQLQYYNGTGKIFPTTEAGYHGFNMKKIYGVSVPNSGINMLQEKLYGKEVMDNIQHFNNPEIESRIDKYKKKTNTPRMQVLNSLRKKQQGGADTGVIVEDKEWVKLQDGTIGKIENAPTHDDREVYGEEGYERANPSEGGVKLTNVESVISATHENRKFSDKSYTEKDEEIKIKPDEAVQIAKSLGFSITRPTKAISPAKLLDLNIEAKNKFISKFKDTGESLDITAMNTVKANKAIVNALPTDEQLYEYIFSLQEGKKSVKETSFQLGGRLNKYIK